MKAGLAGDKRPLRVDVKQCTALEGSIPGDDRGYVEWIGSGRIWYIAC
jgi:hypothetical protein